MKSRTSACITMMTLFAGMAVQVAAQQQTTNFRHYKLIDIGTFGGPVSYINPSPTFGSHSQISQPGAAVGAAATSIPTIPTSNGFVCGGLDGTVPFVNHAFKWQDGVVTDLRTLPGVDNCSVATSINASGEIVGRSENSAIDPVIGSKEIRAVLWKDGEIKDLGTLGGNGSSAGGINSRGQVVGFAFNTIPDPFSIIYFGLAGFANGTQTRAFLWENGVMHDLDTLGGPDAVALFINERGQVAGYSYIDSTPNPVTGLPTIHPFLWTRVGGMKDLGSLGGTVAGSNIAGTSGGFNNRGQLIGLASLAADSAACSNNDVANCHPFLWNGEKLLDLNTETIGANPTSANAINDAGEIVGNAIFPNGASDAYLWRNGVASDLGTLAGDCFSEAFAINPRGQVVGQSFSCVSNTVRTFLWENSSMVDLNALIPPKSSLQLVEVFGINDRGEIGGIGVPPGCPNLDDATCGRAFLLIPVCTDGTEGCEDAPLDPAIVAKSRTELGTTPTTMTAEKLKTFKDRVTGMAGRNRGFRGASPRD